MTTRHTLNGWQIACLEVAMQRLCDSNASIDAASAQQLLGLLRDTTKITVTVHNPAPVLSE